MFFALIVWIWMMNCRGPLNANTAMPFWWANIVQEASVRYRDWVLEKYYSLSCSSMVDPGSKCADLQVCWHFAKF